MSYRKRKKRNPTDTVSCKIRKTENSDCDSEDCEESNSDSDSYNVVGPSYLHSNQKLNMFEPCGQSEQLTVRLRNLLEDYGDGFAVLKELIQNAEDAGASKISFMYDERQNMNLRSKVIGNMAECQGPALWVYNDETFKEKDFRNITKLGGRTKESDRYTIGKFGLGFCSVYNLTDVPSFLSGDSMVILDPHKLYLGDAIKGNADPGIKIDVQNDHIFKTYQHQFQVFNDVFECDMKSKPRYYKGTLFRLPLRTKQQAVKSEIKKLCYNHQEMLHLLQKLESSLGDLLIFTQKLQQIELWHFREDASYHEKLDLVFRADKTVIRTVPSGMNKRSIVQAAGIHLDNTQNTGGKQMDVHQEINIKVSLKKSPLTKRRNDKTYDIRWQVSWSTGKKRARNMAIEKIQKGALSLGSVAVSLNAGLPKPFPFTASHSGFSKDSLLFCFLPLPQESSLPVHVNGCFAVNNDRKQIRSATDDDKSTEESSWNDALISDPICEAYVNLLVELNRSDNNSANGYEYSLLWPKRGNRSSSVKDIVLKSFYSNIVNQDPCIFRNCWNARASFSDCVFLDRELRFDKKIGDVALDCLLNFYGTKGDKTVVMDMDEAVLGCFTDVGLLRDLQSKTMSTYEFYKNIFFPNIQSIRKSQDRDSLVLFAINHQDERLKALLNLYPCLPTLPKLTLRKPQDLVRPNSKISCLFDDSDQRFVSGTKTTFRSETVLDVLVSLGMMHDTLPKEIVIERAKSVSILATCEEQQNRCNRILKYLRRHKCIMELSLVNFLPIRKQQKNWPLKWHADRERKLSRHILKAPKDLFLEQTKMLVGCTRYVIDNETIGSDDFSELLLTLGCSDWSRVKTTDVLQQLKAVSNVDMETLNKNELRELKCITDQIYTFLDNNLSGNRKLMEDLMYFKDKPVLLVNNQLLFPSNAATCSLHGLDCEPEIYQVTNKYPRFFRAIGVKYELEKEYVVNILCDLQSRYERKQNRRLNDKQIKLHSNLLQLLVKVIEVSNSRLQRRDLDQILVPDDESILRHSKDLCIDDRYTKLMRTDNTRFVNENIPPSVYGLLNIKSKLQQHLTSISCALPFGQKEELVTRIRGILENYPFSHSILNELLQNADDAGASEINFVLDKRYHGDSGIFGDSWKDLQGPALCVYNNACFTEKDIEGIVSLGKGSKSNDPTKTGQFGIGFNAVYHITDAPSFISIGKATPNGGTFCAFDPHCEYCPTATQEHPGMRIPDLKQLQCYPGVYKCYLQKELQRQEGTWFRFPLRTASIAERSQLSSEATTVKHIEDLFMNLRGNLVKSLLFLRNIRTVSISVIDKQGEMKNMYSVSSYINTSDNARLQRFFENCYSNASAMKNGQMLLNAVPYEEVCYFANIKDSCWISQQWMIIQGFGISSKYQVSDNLVELVKHGKIGLSPRGGVALNISGESTNDNTDYAFCSLPLQIRTGLPLHVNGSFALDPTRQYIKEDDRVLSPSGLWNKFILGNIIPAVYVKALETLRDYLFKKIPSTEFLYTELKPEALDSYHGFFPLYKTIKSDLWKDTVTQVYRIILEREMKLFPVLQRKSVWWVALRTTSHKFLAYFDDLHEIFKQDFEAKGFLRSMDLKQQLEEKAKSRNRAQQMSFILRDIGMKIIDTPLSILNDITAEGKHDNTNELSRSFQTISASAILNFLISVNSTTIPDGCDVRGLGRLVQETTFRSFSSVQLIIDFCLRKEPDLFSKLLAELPLLLTNDMTLNTFQAVCPLYCSSFCGLFQSSSEQFLAKGLVNVLIRVQQQDSSILRHLQLDTVCKLLPKHFSRNKLEKSEGIPWSNDLMLPTSEWIGEFWYYLDSLQTSELLSSLNTYLGNWCLAPAVYKQKRLIPNTLVPIGVAYSILDVDSFEDENYKEVFSSLAVPNTVSWCNSRTLSDVVASAKRPESILKLLHYHREMLSFVENTAKEKILQWLNVQLGQNTQLESRLQEMLRALPIYRTVTGNYITLDKMQQTILILKENENHDFPLDGITEWATKSRFVLLYQNNAHQHIELRLGATICTEAKLYMSHVLPRFQHLAQSFHLTHLEYIRDHILPFNEIAPILKKVRFVPYKDGLRTAGHYFNPHIGLCSVMCSWDQLPPKPFHKEDWEGFMICAGINNEVTVDMLENFAREIQNQGANGISEDIRRKSGEMLEHLLERVNLIYEGILPRIKDIRFVVPCKVPWHLNEIHRQYNENKLINFSSSARHSDKDLIWSTMSILPQNATFTSNSNEIRRQLGINNIPPLTAVVSHVHNVCTSLQNMADRSKLGGEKLQTLMDTIYSYLQKNGQCDAAIKGLSETNLVLIPDKQCLVKASQTVENMLQQDEIPPLLMKVPMRYGRYRELFKYYGGTENVTLLQYAETLKCLYNNSTEGYLIPKEHGNAGKAFSGLVDILSAKTNEEIENELKSVEHLYLLNDRSDRRCMKSTDMIVPDNKAFEKRLKSLQLSYVHKCKNNEIYRKLPRNLRPRYFSNTVVEHLFTEHNELLHDEMTNLVQQLIHSSDFRRGVNAIRKKASDNIADDPGLSHRLKNINVHCVGNIVTVLWFQEAMVMESKQSVECFIDDRSSTILVRKDNWENHLSSFLTAVKDPISHYICRIFSIPVDKGRSEIKELLYYAGDLKGLKSHVQEMINDDEDQNEDDWCPVLGSHVPIALHCLLDNAFSELEVDDIVAYEIWDSAIDDEEGNGDDQIFIYSKIKSKILPDSEDILEQQYCIDIGEKGCKNVPAVKLYRFIRKPTETCTDMVVFTAGRNEASNFNKNAIFKEIKQILTNAWKKSENERKTIVKRLLLKWHPDKNPDCQELSTEITQFIFNVIENLENGEPKEPNSFANTHFHGSKRKKKHKPFKQSPNSFKQWEAFGNRMGQRTYTDYKYSSKDRVPNPQPGEAKRWFKQAKLDLAAAKATLRIAKDAKAFNWVCVECHQACEKAWKAIGIAQDMDMVNMKSHNLIYINSNLSLEIDETIQPMLRQMEELVKSYAGMRYPDTCPFPSVPGEVYKENHAIRALDFAESILEKIAEAF